MENKILQILKWINSIPFPWAAKHYAFFGDMNGQKLTGVSQSERWRILRVNHPRYRIPNTHEAWLKDLEFSKDGQDSKLAVRIKSFSDFLEKEGIKTVYSIGSGGGVFEYFLKKKLSHVKIIVSEPDLEAVERLRGLCLGYDDVQQFNALSVEDWRKKEWDSDTLIFIYRNEREFNDAEWRKIFINMHQARVKRVFLGLMNFLTALAYVKEKVRNFRHRFGGRELVFVGHLRNYYKFRSFWKMMYIDKEIYFSGGRGVYLRIID